MNDSDSQLPIDFLKWQKNNEKWIILRQAEALMQSLGAMQYELIRQLLSPDRPTIVCLCGSVLFVKEFHKANLEEALSGKVVLSAGLIGYNEEDLRNSDNESKIKFVHRENIKISDEILILNKGGYLDDATYDYFLLARSLKKEIRWLEPDNIPTVCSDYMDS